MEALKPCIINLKTQERHQLFDGITIGRSRSSDINIDDTKVSRVHLSIKFLNNNELLIEDSSSNGTYVNNEKISGSCKISSDSVIRVGSTDLKISFHDDNKSSPRYQQEVKSTPKIKLVKNFEISYADYPNAPFFKRSISTFIDNILITIAGQLIQVLFSLFVKNDVGLLIFSFFGQVAFGVYYYYHFLNLNYQTIGKKAMKLMVVPTDDRKKFSVLRVLGREYVLKAFVGFFSIFTVLFTKDKLAIHDYINKTRVIDVSKGT